jgi:type IV pilus assembly protein PilN
MPRINLLPWRAEERKEKKLAFVVAIMGATVASLVAAFGAYMMLNAMIDSQLQRNARLREEIKLLDKQIEEINSLESAKQKFIARMEIIEKLQRSRPEIVHVFDEIVKQLPEGVYLTSVKQTSKMLKFEGVAQSSTRVSTFMRNIDASEWLQKPSLDIIENKQGQTIGSSFIMTAEQVSTAAEEEAAAGGKKVASAGGAR